MTRFIPWILTAALAAAISPAAAQAPPDRRGYTGSDVDFMSGMISVR